MKPVFFSCMAALLLPVLTGFAEPILIAHRGASYDAPENTLAAFRLAWEKGADGIEGDFYLTSDGKILCIHDSNTKKTTGQDLAVAKTDFATLRELDVGSWKAAAFKGERMPTLLEVLETVPAGKRIYIEIKCGTEIIPQLQRDLAASDLKDEQIRIISFKPAVIRKARQQLPGISAYWLTSFKKKSGSEDWHPTASDIVEVLNETGANGVGCKAHDRVDPDFVKTIRDVGKELHVWTVNTRSTAKQFQDLGVDSITTDRPAFLRDALKP